MVGGGGGGWEGDTKGKVLCVARPFSLEQGVIYGPSKIADDVFALKFCRVTLPW